MGTIRRNELCPCGSGKKAKKCCLEEGELRPKPIILPINNTLNGNLATCYARNFNQCNGGASKEHYLSKAILDQIGDPILLDGLPFLRGEKKAFKTNSLCSKILCQYHNNLLSAFDEKASRLFSELHKFNKLKKEHIPLYDSYSIFCAEDIERWFLKFVIGTKASQIKPENYYSSFDIELLDYLFKNKKFNGHQGLYIDAYSQSREQQINIDNTVHLSFRPGLKKNLGFAQICFSDIYFYLILEDVPKLSDIINNNTIVRPKTITIRDSGFENKIEFFWNRPVTEGIGDLVLSDKK